MAWKKKNNKKKVVKRRPRRSFPTRRGVFRVPTYIQTLSTQRGKYVRLRYVEATSIDVSTAGAAAGYVWAANSIYDPNQTGVGGQPFGHDELAAVYNKYCVVSSRIKACFSPRTAANEPPAQVGILLNGAGGLPSTSVSTIIAQQLCPWAQLPYDKACSRNIVCNFSAKSFFNIKDVKDNMDNLGAAFGANPAELATFTVWAGCESGSDTGIIDVLVVIDYVVYVSEAKPMPTS